MAARGTRHAGRELALKMLFQVDVGKVPVSEVLASFTPDEEIGEPPASAIAFGHALVRGTAAHLREIDALLASLAEEWAFDRLANVDRNILRLAVYELLHGKGVPEEIVINEAVELAKEYSTEESSRFVNGILGNLSRQRAAGTLRLEPSLGRGEELPPVEELWPVEEQPAVPETDGTAGPAGPPRRRRQPLRMGPEG